MRRPGERGRLFSDTRLCPRHSSGERGAAGPSDTTEAFSCSPSLMKAQKSIVNRRTYNQSVVREASTSQKTPEMLLFCSSTGAMGEYEPKIEVRFPDTVYAAKGSSVRLECFALGK